MNRKLFIVLFTLFAVAINFLGRILANLIGIALYLDSLLTISVSALCGLVPAVICAVLSNLFFALAQKTSFLFVICHITTAIIASVIFHFEKKRIAKCDNKSFSLDSFLWAGFWSAVSNGIGGSVISYFILGGLTVRNIANAVQGIYFAIHNLPLAVLIGGILTNLADKMLSAIVSYFVYLGLSKIAGGGYYRRLKKLERGNKIK